jgi:hypothetical protein
VKEGLDAGSNPNTWLVTFSSKVRPENNPVVYDVDAAYYDQNWNGSNFKGRR